jgi:hypothetical protein
MNIHTVAAFDLGIKNLSYCVANFDGSGNLVDIPRWANLNLLADGADSQSQTRCSCGGPASFQNIHEQTGGEGEGEKEQIVTLLCKKCAKKSAKPILDLVLDSKTKTKTITLADWRAWIPTIGVSPAVAKKSTKAQLIVLASAVRLLPYSPPKIKQFSLQKILKGMETCLDSELVFLSQSKLIRVENQPSDFAPHMKSVQIMLFTLLDHRLRTEFAWTGTIEFANASVKTRGTAATTGKDGKRSRKLAAIEKVTDLLRSSSAESCTKQFEWWKSQAKQDDLADAFLMCYDKKQ